MERFKYIKNQDLEALPKTPGVYAFFTKNLKFKIKNLKLECIYIGKAINIKARVKNHFLQPSYRDNLFINQVDKIGFFETNSEIEALILEANLIKKYQPKFNVVWRDDKNYFYVAIAQNAQKIPYIFITHQPNSSSLRGAAATKQSRLLRSARNDGTKYIGPFVEGTALKKTLRFLRRAFPYYTTKNHPKITAAAGPRPGGANCLYCHLGLCPGPLLFENPPSPKASEGLREYRRNIKKLILILQGKRSAVLNSLKKEMCQLSKESKFEEAGKIRDRIYNLQQVMSHTHVINNGSEHGNENSFTHKFDDRHFYEKGNGWDKTEKKLQEILWQSLRGAEATKQSINRIECYDVSNIQGKFATGSMVVFINGAPDKNLYRKFKIKMENEPNDIAMLKETLQRRFLHPEWPFPDAILIDGGKAQLNVALKIVNSLKIENLKLKISVMSIAKGKQELFIEGRNQPIPLKSLPQEIYNLVKQLDDEAHRFAIAYHKKLRKKSLLQ